MNKKIAAVVVTYNRKELLQECLDSLLNQTRPLDSIILIDNASTDGTPEMLKEKGYLDMKVIDYVRLEKNTGGAGGFYYGVKRGYEKGFDWLWLMDDDAEPEKTTLFILEEQIEKYHINGIICPIIKHKLTGQFQWYHHKFLPEDLSRDIPIVEKLDINDIMNMNIIKIDANAFVGPLINCKAIAEVGFPEKDYFIWSDDLEYTYRISRKKDCLLCTKTFIYHKDNNIDSSGLISKTSVWKIYYGIRNRLMFVLKHQVKSKYKFKYISLALFKSVRSSLSLFIKRKAGKYSLLPIKGFVDGLFGRSGILVKPFKL